MNRDLFLAILAMDSYHRGYGQGIKEGHHGLAKIGKAVIIKDSADDERIAA